MNIPLDYYRTFYYVAKYGSLTKAANALHANQPNVTRTMNKLEQNLSCRLMIRSNRGIVLTAEGRKLFAHVDRAMRQFDDAQKELNGDMQLEQGIITIGASETALNLLLLDVLKQFHYDYPHISLRILNHANPLALRSVEDGEADFAVLTTPHRKHPGFVSVPLLSYQEILVGGKSFTALSFQSLSLHDLESYSMISMSRETLSYQFHSDLFASHGALYHPDTEVATADQILPMVKHELGIAFLPEIMAREDLANGSIVQLHLQEEIPRRQIALVYDRHRPISPAARRLMDRLMALSKQNNAHEKRIW